jgi:hypothetical protein
MEIKAKHKGEWGLPSSLIFKEPVDTVGHLPSVEEVGTVRWVNSKERLYVKMGGMDQWEPVPEEYEDMKCEVDLAGSLGAPGIPESEDQEGEFTMREVAEAEMQREMKEPERGPTAFEKAMEKLSDD